MCLGSQRKLVQEGARKAWELPGGIADTDYSLSQTFHHKLTRLHAREIHKDALQTDVAILLYHHYTIIEGTT